jgi:uncharacterized protein
MTELAKTLVGEFIDAVADDPEHARLLLSGQPELLNARWSLGETVLHFLAVEGYNDAVRRLVEWGADVNLVNTFGDPPLHDCVVLGNEPLVELLLSHGANPHVVSETTGPLLLTAVKYGRPGVVRRLLAAGADAGVRSELDESAFDVLPTRPDQRDAMLALFSELGIARDR